MYSPLKLYSVSFSSSQSQDGKLHPICLSQFSGTIFIHIAIEIEGRHSKSDIYYD